MDFQEFITKINLFYNVEFIDRARLLSYTRQLEEGRTRFSTAGFKLEFSLPFVNLTADLDRGVTSEDADGIRSIAKALKRADRFPISEVKSRFDVRDDAFFYYSGMATPFVVPHEIMQLVNYEERLIVWLIEEERLELPDNPSSEPGGSFIFLIQRKDDGGTFSGCPSAYSATQHLMEELSIISSPLDPREKCAREDFRSPEDVLLDVGAKKYSSREIVTMYRLRSMSDDFYLKVREEVIRFNDAVAYPLFIVSL